MMDRTDHFNRGIADYLGGPSEDEANAKTRATMDDFGESEMDPATRARNQGVREGIEHHEKLKSMSGPERKAYLGALDEAIGQKTKPERGDAQNPRIKNMPRQPRAPREVSPVQKAMKTAKTLGRLAAKSKGRRR